MTTRIAPATDLPERLSRLRWKRPLYLRGAALDAGPAIAIVGARAASQVGMDRAFGLARHLAAAGIQVVSGGALGIDGAAHRGALAGGGKTTVVLGNGLDLAYPQRHRQLFADVLAAGGTLAGIMADGAEPNRRSFVARNPLISALADAVLVIEADVRSGSLSTATAARKQQRVVAAWPGSRGCDQLLATGAALVESVADVDAIVAGTPRFPVPAPRDAVARTIATAIANGATTVDQIVAATGLTVRVVLRALPTLERCS